MTRKPLPEHFPTLEQIKAKREQARAEKEAKRAARMSYKDIQIMYLTKGVSEIEKSLNEKLVGVSALRKAYFELKKGCSVPLAELEKFLSERNIKTDKRPGRKPPEVGSTRVYKANQNSGPYPYLHVPLVNCAKGDRFKATFEENRIILEKVNQPPE